VTNKPDTAKLLKPVLLEESPYMKDGIIYNSSGEPFHIIHQYDRVPEFMEYYSKKYELNITEKTDTGSSPKYFINKS
jgi:hypothetical protein